MEIWVLYLEYIYNDGFYFKKNFFWFVRKMLKGVCFWGIKNGFIKNNIWVIKLIYVELFLFFKKIVYFLNNLYYFVWISLKMIIVWKKKMVIIWWLKLDILLVIY